MKLKHLSLITIIAWFVISCGPKEVDPVINQFLTSSELKSEDNKDKVAADITGSLGGGGGQASFISSFVRYGLKKVVISYKTKNSDGTEIMASGALFIPILVDPKSTETFPLASIQHGTIFDDAQAPSKFNLGSEASIGTLLASTGYIVAMPDYIGYGKSNNLPHPYEHRESLAQSSLDLLRAVKEYMAEQKTPWNKNLYIGGYSEGGFASMSLLKMIEEKASTEFTLKAASLGAGAYNKTAFTKFVASNKTTPAAQFNQSYIWVILTYDRIYKLNKPMTTYFKEPYATQIAASKEKVQLNVPMIEILNESFKKAIVDGTGMSFLAAVKDNDVFDWKPNTPLRLYHGTVDDYVNFFNSQNAFDAMKKRGAANVTLNKIEGKNHQTSVQDYLLGTLDFFGSNK